MQLQVGTWGRARGQPAQQEVAVIKWHAESGLCSWCASKGRKFRIPAKGRYEEKVRSTHLWIFVLDLPITATCSYKITMILDCSVFSCLI